MYINKQMDKQIWHSHTMKYYLIIKKDQSIDNMIVYYNMDKPWEHCAQWKKPVIKDCTCSTHMKFRKGIYRDRG